MCIDILGLLIANKMAQTALQRSSIDISGRKIWKHFSSQKDEKPKHLRVFYATWAATAHFEALFTTSGSHCSFGAPPPPPRPC